MADYDAEVIDDSVFELLQTAKRGTWTVQIHEVVGAVAEPDAVEPSVGGVSPANGTPIDPEDTVSFNVTDLDPGLRAVILWISFRGYEEPILVYDGTSFQGRFSDSTVVAITNGYTFTLRMTDGWIASIQELTVRAYDTAGNEAE